MISAKEHSVSNGMIESEGVLRVGEMLNAMTTTPAEPRATTAPDAAALYRDWAMAGAALCIGLCALGLIYWTEVDAAVRTWSDSYAYGHCFLVLPVALYLAWDRRSILASLQPGPAPSIALLAIPVAVSWFVVDRLGVMEGRQLVAVALFQVMFAAIFGMAVWRAFAAPLLYLFFLVPFGYFIVPTLQNVTTHFAATGLDLLGIPNYPHGDAIDITEGQFSVEQACAGLRFILAMAAISIPYGCIMYTSALRRTVFVGVLLAGAFIGNCFRVLFTILIAHWTGAVALVEAQHKYWGWGFYVIVGAVMLVVGARFAQERPAEDAPAGYSMATPTRRLSAAAIALAAVILVAASPRVAADYLSRVAAGTAFAAPIELSALPGCTGPSSMSVAMPSVDDVPAPGESAAGNYECSGDPVQVAVYRYSPRVDVRLLLGSVRATEEPPVADGVFQQTGEFRPSESAETPAWHISQEATPDGRTRTTASALWLDGKPSGLDMAARAGQAWNTVRPTPVAPLLVVVTNVSGGSPQSARQGVEQLLSDKDGLTRWARSLAANPASR